IYNCQYYCKPKHIFLCVLQVTASKVFLHHILIQSGHHYGNKSPADKLFYKMVTRFPIVKKENLAHIAFSNKIKKIAARKPEVCSHIILRNSNSHQHKESLQRIGPHNGFYATFKGVKPNQQNGNGYGYPKRNIQRIKNQALHNNCNKVKPETGADNS